MLKIMKKSKLRNIIKESIKELMNEQLGGSGQYIRVNTRTCNGGSTFGSVCVESGAQIGDVRLIQSPGIGSSTRKVFIRDTIGTCNSSQYNYYHTQPNHGPVPQPTACNNCCNASGPGGSGWKQFSSQAGGACWVIGCGNTPPSPGCTDPTANNYDPNATVDDGSCNFGPGSFGTTGNYTVFNYPSGFDVTDWTNNFVNMIMNHPNPCNFLVQRIGQFYSAMGNQISFDINGNVFNPQDLIVGPLQANMLMQKLVVCVELYSQLCAGIQEQSGNISQIIQTAKNIKMDPKIGGIVKQAVIKLRDKMSKPADPKLDRMQKLAGIPTDKPMDKPEKK